MRLLDNLFCDFLGEGLDCNRTFFVPLEQIFWNLSEKFVPTVGQPHEGKSVHALSAVVKVL